MNTDLAKALAYDPIADAEKLTGRSYKEDDSVTFLGMALMQQQKEVKDALLFLNRDTNSRKQTISEFFAVLADMGFREVLKLAITGTPDHFHIFWKPGLLVQLDTYFGRVVNGGACYFNFRGPREAIRGSSNSWIQDTENGPEWSGGIDIREGLRHRLDTMAESGELLKKWEQRPFLWLLHYMDTKTQGYDYRAINSERIAMLPEDVRTAISPANA